MIACSAARGDLWPRALAHICAGTVPTGVACILRIAVQPRVGIATPPGRVALGWRAGGRRGLSHPRRWPRSIDRAMARPACPRRTLRASSPRRPRTHVPRLGLDGSQPDAPRLLLRSAPAAASAWRRRRRGHPHPSRPSTLSTTPRSRACVRDPSEGVSWTWQARRGDEPRCRSSSSSLKPIPDRSRRLHRRPMHMCGGGNSQCTAHQSAATSHH